MYTTLFLLSLCLTIGTSLDIKVQESNAYLDNLLSETFPAPYVGQVSRIPLSLTHVDGFEVEQIVDVNTGRYLTHGRKFGHRKPKYKYAKYALFYQLARKGLNAGSSRRGFKPTLSTKQAMGALGLVGLGLAGRKPHHNLNVPGHGMGIFGGHGHKKPVLGIPNYGHDTSKVVRPQAPGFVVSGGHIPGRMPVAPSAPVLPGVMPGYSPPYGANIAPAPGFAVPGGPIPGRMPMAPSAPVLPGVRPGYSPPYGATISPPRFQPSTSFPPNMGRTAAPGFGLSTNWNLPPVGVRTTSAPFLSRTTSYYPFSIRTPPPHSASRTSSHLYPNLERTPSPVHVTRPPTPRFRSPIYPTPGYQPRGTPSRASSSGNRYPSSSGNRYPSSSGSRYPSSSGSRYPSSSGSRSPSSSGGSRTSSGSSRSSSGGSRSGSRKGRRSLPISSKARVIRSLDRGIKINLKSGNVIDLHKIRRLGDCSPPMRQQGNITLACYVQLDGVKVNFTGDVVGERSDWIAALAKEEPISVVAMLKNSAAFIEVTSLPRGTPKLSAWSIMPSELKISYSRTLYAEREKREELEEQIEAHINEDVTDYLYGPLQEGLADAVKKTTLPLPRGL